jgi:hypothetical protein
MTGPTPVTAPVGSVVRSCDVCSHPAAAHDHIARRFCMATMINALSRNCICSASA